MFRKRNPTERPKSKVEKRAAALPTSELIGWSESAVYSVGRNLSYWQRDPNKFYLEEAKLSAEALLAIVNTLEERTKHSER